MPATPDDTARRALPARTETDSMGAVSVPAGRYWGAQTQRALENFTIGTERMPLPLVRALGVQKKAAALANMELGMLEMPLGSAIAAAAQEVMDGALDDHFPLRGLADRFGHPDQHECQRGHRQPRDRDARRRTRLARSLFIPTTTSTWGNPRTTPSRPSCTSPPCEQLHHRLIPALQHLQDALQPRRDAFEDIVKIGRTHLQDATPVTLGQEFSGYATQLQYGIARVTSCLPRLSRARAGRNGGRHRAELQARLRGAVRGTRLRRSPAMPFTTAENKFEAIAAHDAIVQASGHLNTLACSLMKIANDIRLLASGPRCGLGEIHLPENEPGSSIMPGKVNPTQCRGHDHGLRAGDRQPYDDLGGRQQRPSGAQRLQAGDDLQPAAVDRPAGRRLPQLHGPLRRRASRPTDIASTSC